MESPLEVKVYAPDFSYRQDLPSVESLTFTPRFNAQGTGELHVPSDAPITEFLNVPGARYICTYRDEHLSSGQIRNPTGSLAPGGTTIYQLQDDWRIFANTIARPRPGQPAEVTSLTEIGQAWQTKAAGPVGSAKGQSGYFLWPDDVSSAEAAVKHLITTNLVHRLARPVTIAPNLDRGGDARAAGLIRNDAIRNVYLDVALEELLAWSGLGLRAYQRPGDRAITVDVWEPTPWPQALDVESGIVIDPSWSRTDPEGTRILIGGPGEDAARAFYELADLELEDDTNDVIELFKDATQNPPTWPDALAEELKVFKYYALRPEVAAADRAAFRASLHRAGLEALDEAGLQIGVSAELAETESFHFGGSDGIHLGDPIVINAAGQPFADRLTAATLSLGDSGFSVTPQLGAAPTDEDEEVWRAIGRLAATFRNLATRR